MKGVVLAAGRGTRLAPLTDDRPKCMVPLRGVPVLHRQLAALSALGVDDVTVVVGHRAGAVTVPRSFPGSVRLVHNDAYARTNMVASLACADDALRSGDRVLVSYGDIVCEPRVLSAVAAADADLAVAVDLGWRTYWERRFDDPLDDAETLRYDGDGRLVDIGRRPRTVEEVQAQYIGLLALSPLGADRLLTTWEALRREDPAAADAMYMTDLLRALVDRGDVVRAVPVRHGWLEFDGLRDVQLFEDGQVDDLYVPAERLGPGRADRAGDGRARHVAGSAAAGQ